MKESIFAGLNRKQLLSERARLTKVRDTVEAEVSKTIADAQARAHILTLIERQIEDIDGFLS